MSLPFYSVAALHDDKSLSPLNQDPLSIMELAAEQLRIVIRRFGSV